MKNDADFPDVTKVMEAQHKIMEALKGFRVRECVSILIQVMFRVAANVGAPLEDFTKSLLDTIESISKHGILREMFEKETTEAGKCPPPASHS